VKAAQPGSVKCVHLSLLVAGCTPLPCWWLAVHLSPAGGWLYTCPLLVAGCTPVHCWWLAVHLSTEAVVELAWQLLSCATPPSCATHSTAL